MPSVELGRLLGEELARGIDVFAGGRTRVDYEELRPEEEDAVERCFRAGLEHLEKVAPTIAASIRPQLGLALKFAGVAKAIFPESKPIAFPSEPGTIGVNWLFPQAIKAKGHAGLLDCECGPTQPLRFSTVSITTTSMTPAATATISMDCPPNGISTSPVVDVVPVAVVAVPKLVTVTDTVSVASFPY